LKTFLDQIIDRINTEYHDISKVILILPSKRACLFFKERLIKSGLRSSWLPKVLTLNQFVESVFPGKIENHLTQLSELYSIARKMKLSEADSFENFYRWGDVLLHDFNSIDSYEVEGKDLYRNLKEIEKIERWSFLEDPLSENQIAFNDFWMKQGDIYAEFNILLKQRNSASGAMALKWINENIDTILSRFEENHFIIAGFNALSKGEQKLTSRLLKIGNSYFLPDNDVFFVKGKREAGHFYRQLKKNYHWKGLNELNDSFAQDPKEIEIISVTQRSAMALVCAQLLAKESDLSNTALVLGDESLLQSVITTLPKNVGSVNITMGYSLRDTPAYDLFLSFYAIQLRIKSKSKEIYHKDFIRFLNHPYVAKLFGEKFIRELKQLIVSQNLIFISKKHLKELKVENKLPLLMENMLFSTWKNFPDDPAKQLLYFSDEFSKILDVEKQALDLEYLFHFKKIIQQLSKHIDNYKIVMGLSGYKVLFTELLKSQSISFQGEPLEGLQVMGLLETRSLDFEHIILIGANEGSIPKTSFAQSFIPWDLKHYFGLPGRKEQDALYAYYFYRLIQRAKKISFIYNSNSGKDLKSVEASRYLRQLSYYKEKGLLNFNIKEYQVKLDHLPKPLSEIKLLRDDFYRDKLKEKLEKSASPTSLATYLNCPLDFYFKYILGLRESDEIDEEMGADVIGNIIHKVLETLYKPYVGSQPDFSKIESELESVLKEEISKEMKNRWITTGINQMNIQIIKTLLIKFLKIDKHFIDDQAAQGNRFEIVNLEEGLSRKFTLEVNGESIVVNLKGIADRIDKVNSTLRIIDYKTGKVEKLNRVEVSKVFEDASWSKALQLLMYRAMYDNFSDTDLEVGIVGFRDLNKYVQSVNLKKDNEDNVKELFFKGLQDLLHSMFYDTSEIIHNPKSKWCKFCELK